jgi:hypothetical protein
MASWGTTMTRVARDDGSAWLRSGAAILLAAYLVVTLYVLWRAADHHWLAYLLAPHNISRPLWTRLAIALDMGALGGTNVPLILSGAAALGAMAWILGKQVARAAPQPLKLPAVALAAMLILMPSNIFDASTPINITYPQAAVFAVLAIVLSEGALTSAFGWRGAAAIVCAAASSLGNGVGLAIWPVMAWGALQRRDWSWLGTVLICGAAFLGFYLAGQEQSAGSTSAAALNDPWSAVILALGFVALPWTRVAVQIAWIAGALIATAAIAIILVKGGPKATPVERIACGLMLFTLGAAAMAGLGRTGLEDAHNVPVRYAVLVAPLHIGLLMLGLPLLGAVWRNNRRMTEGLIVTALLALFAQNAVMAIKVIEVNDITRNTIADFHAGLRTPHMLTLIHPDLAHAQAISDRLRRDNLFQHELHLKPRTP